MLDTVDPLTLGVEPSVSLHCRYYGGGGDFHLARPLNDFFKCRTNVSLALGEKI